MPSRSICGTSSTRTVAPAPRAISRAREASASGVRSCPGVDARSRARHTASPMRAPRATAVAIVFAFLASRSTISTRLSGGESGRVRYAEKRWCPSATPSATACASWCASGPPRTAAGVMVASTPARRSRARREARAKAWRARCASNAFGSPSPTTITRFARPRTGCSTTHSSQRPEKSPERSSAASAPPVARFTSAATPVSRRSSWNMPSASAPTTRAAGLPPRITMSIGLPRGEGRANRAARRLAQLPVRSTGRRERGMPLA